MKVEDFTFGRVHVYGIAFGPVFETALHDRVIIHVLNLAMQQSRGLVWVFG